MDTKLLNCPFCGGEGELDSHIEFSEWGDWYWIRCCDCKTAGPPRHTESEAVAAWNTRVKWKLDTIDDVLRDFYDMLRFGSDLPDEPDTLEIAEYAKRIERLVC